MQTLNMGEFVSLLFLSFSDAEECGISKWQRAERLGCAPSSVLANTHGLLMMRRRNCIFQTRLMENITQLPCLPACLPAFLPTSFPLGEGVFYFLWSLRIARNKSQAATKDLNMGKAHRAPSCISCLRYRFDFHQPPVDLGSEVQMPSWPHAGLLAGLSQESSKLIPQVDANIFRRACSFGICSAFHYIRDSPVSWEGNMHIQGLLQCQPLQKASAAWQ